MAQTPPDRPKLQSGARWSLMRTLQIAIPMVALIAVVAVLISDRRHQSELAAAMPEGCAGRTSAEIGGPFTLIDQDGRPFTEANLKGRPSLIYFGFTYCPDVCPTSLQIMRRALDEAGEAGRNIQPVLVSVDPERDTPEALKSYVASAGFPQGLIGLTGTREQVRAAARAYKVGYQKIDTPESAAEYLVDHSSIMYLMDSDGNLATFFSNSPDPSTVAQCIKALASEGL